MFTATTPLTNANIVDMEEALLCNIAEGNTFAAGSAHYLDILSNMREGDAIGDDLIDVAVMMGWND